MDLLHLLSSDGKPESSGTEGTGDWRERERETLYKRRGINFSTSTSEGRILRSSQVSPVFIQP